MHPEKTGPRQSGYWHDMGEARGVVCGTCPVAMWGREANNEANEGRRGVMSLEIGVRGRCKFGCDAMMESRAYLLGRLGIQASEHFDVECI